MSCFDKSSKIKTALVLKLLVDLEQTIYIVTLLLKYITDNSKLKTISMIGS